jgi:hypothetical protein
MRATLRHSGTLSGNILRLRSMLPPVEGHFEIEGDTVRTLDRCLDPPEPVGTWPSWPLKQDNGGSSDNASA